MARRKDPKPENNALIRLFLLIPNALIAIGNGVRYPFRLVVYLLSVFYNILKILVTESSYAMATWVREKLFERKKAKKIKFSFPKFRLPTFKKRLTKLPPPPAVVHIAP